MLAVRRLVRRGVVSRRWCSTGSSGSSNSSGGSCNQEEKLEWYALWRSQRGRRYLRWIATGYAVTLGIVLYAKAAVERSAKELQQNQQKAASKLSLGGHFTLTDHHGRSFDTASLSGKWWVVYFGFASCPTVCPAELRKITDTLTALEADFGQNCVTPIFVSVDPARDTPETLRSFLAPFHPSFIGLTGTEAEVKEVASKFRVYYSVIDTEDQNLQAGESPEDYQIDHSCIIYLMNPNGKFCDFFSKETDGGVAVAKVARHLDGTMAHVDQ